MKKYVVVSTTNNPDYYFYFPYIEQAWNSYGWDVCLMVTELTDINKIDIRNKSTLIVNLPSIKGLRDATIAQAGRLYAANYLPLDALIMTSDIDLLPLSDYWHPKIDDITVYGHDLTWFNYYPMGYIAMSGHNWKKYMNCTDYIATDMLRDANETKIAFAEDWEQWWNFDWDLVTKRLKPFESQITFINRGQINIAGATLAKGRIDRYNWIETQKQDTFIDAHCENVNVQHPDKLNKFLEVFEKFHGKI